MGINAAVFTYVLALIAFVAFQQWLRHHRRMMIHRERMAVIEKGLELPPLEQEVQRRAWGVGRILLLAGLSWISLGIGVFVVLNAMIGQSSLPIPPGLQWIGVPLVGVGLSHLIVYALERRKED
jgi:hypothetical protein